MKKSLSSKILAPLILVTLLMATFLFSSTASAAGTSDGMSIGHLVDVVDIDDPNLIPNLKSGKYLAPSLIINYTSENHIITQELYDALEVRKSQSEDVEIYFRSQDLKIEKIGTSDSLENFIEWKFPNDFPLVGFNLGVTATRADQITDPNYVYVADRVKNDDALFLNFAYSGKLSKPVEIRFISRSKNSVSSVNYFSQQDINVYYCPPNSLFLDLVAKNIPYMFTTTSFGAHVFELTHMSTYLLKVGEYTAPQTVIENNDTTNNKSSSKNSSSGSTLFGNTSNSSSESTTSGVNPSTGSADELMISVGGLLLVSCSTVVALRKKK